MGSIFHSYWNIFKLQSYVLNLYEDSRVFLDEAPSYD